MAASKTAPAESGLDHVLRSASMLVTCGPGGVGKTTTAAALALAAANTGRKVIVVTVDPARRLADALGVDGSVKSHDPHQVEGAVTHAKGSLWVLMLDSESTFDRMIIDRAGDERKAQAILSNPVYRSIAGSLAGAQEYMAIERLHQLSTGGEYDLIVIDTPPSRHAIDLLEAPDRLVKFFGHPVYRAVAIPGRSFARVTNTATGAFLWAVRRLAGPKVVEDTIEFFRSLAGLEEGLRERAAEASQILRDDKTAFVLVSSPRAEAIDEATHLATALKDGGFPLQAIVVNLVHPAPEPLTQALVDAADETTGPLADLVAFHRELSQLTTDESSEMTALSDLAGAVPVVKIPVLDEDIHDLPGLAHLGTFLLAE
jgi:anion-transporting  ArsA/GET3 family ATPase